MIIDFTVRNFLSIKDEVTLSFLAKKQDPDLKIIPIKNTNYKLYSFSAIYGPNASGKTNIIRAISALKEFILNSYQSGLDNPIPVYKPFKLDNKCLTQPTLFEIEFVTNNIRYTYSVEFTKTQITKEELWYFPKKRRALLFLRDEQGICKYGSTFTGNKKQLETFLLPNRLFLSVAAQSTNIMLRPVLNFFNEEISLHIRMDSSTKFFYNTTHKLKKSNHFKKLLQTFLQSADGSISDIMIKEDHNNEVSIDLPDDMPEEMKKLITFTMTKKPFLGHPVFDGGVETDQIEYFNLEDEESSGTIKMYDIASEIVETLQNGGVLIIDEFNSGLHPLLCKYLIQLFIDPDVNINNAQLLISTHDTCALDIEILKREQIWFTEKNTLSSTELFSLDEFKLEKNLVRDGSKFSRHYLSGRFGAIPGPNPNQLIKELFYAKE